MRDDYLSKEQANIASSFNIFKTPAFETKAAFKELILYSETLKAAASVVNTAYNKFKRSSQKDAQAKGVKRWSLVDLVFLLNAVESTRDILRVFQVDGLSTICSKDPLNAQCYLFQGGVVKFMNSTQRSIDEIMQALSKFVSSDYKYNLDLLYIYENWEKRTDLSNGYDFIVNVDNESERFYLNPVLNLEDDLLENV